jgi:uncharacterized protein YbjQ (UPF0145 family)|tara:strand:+ start:544 stop:816 length:273 start_codon:yes stop_codon:yes gene_type:complete
MHFYLVQVLTICDTLGVVKGDTVMTEQQQKQLVDSMNTLIDQIVDAVKLQAVIKVDDAMEDLNEMKIREIAREEALEAVRDGDITVSIEA